jgi:hypothetical protein
MSTKEDEYLLLQKNNQILLEAPVKNTTRSTLLVSVAAAALMVGAGLASAQDTKEKGEAPGAAAHGQAPAGKMDQHPGSLPQKSPAPTAQAPATEKPAATAQAPAAPKPETTAPGSAAQTSESPTPHAAPSAAKGDTKSGAPAALSSEQNAKFRDSLRGGKAERMTNVQFSIAIGGIIPGSVQLYSLPVSIVEYAPQYRDYEYILVGDEILIVDPRTLRIVAVIEA